MEVGGGSFTSTSASSLKKISNVLASLTTSMVSLVASMLFVSSLDSSLEKVSVVSASLMASIVSLVASMLLVSLGHSPQIGTEPYLVTSKSGISNPLF